MHRYRPPWTLTACLGLFLVSCQSPAAPDPPSRPSFVLILVDALRADHLTPWGYPRDTSPFLAELAEQGVLCRHAYAQSSQTFVSTATLLTSSYFPYLVSSPGSNEEIPDLADERRQRPPEGIPVLADHNVLLFERLQEAGYRTAAFFTNPHHHAGSGFWSGLDHALYLAPDSEIPYARGDAVNSAVKAWLNGLSGASPFAIYVHYMDVHNPYRPPARYAREFVEVVGEDKYRNAVPTGEDVPSPQDLEYMISLYDACIRHVDDLIRDLHEWVRSRFPRQETVFILSSDHGDEFMEHGGLGHGRTLEYELIHVPLLISGSGVLPRGARLDRPVRNLDIGPTMLDLAGLPVPEGVEGRSLVPASREEGGGPAPPSFARYGGVQSITTQGWHLLLNRRTGEMHLYDLESDSQGRDDVQARFPRQVAILRRQLDHFEARNRKHMRVNRALDHLQRGESVPVDPSIRDQLEALGYLD